MAKEEPKFVHLDVNSEYSIGQSVIRIEDLLNKSLQCQMPALGIADNNNLFAAFKFYKRAIEIGVKPIIGATVSIRPGVSERISKLILLCKNTTGYKNLSNLITRSYLEGYQKDKALFDIEWLDNQSSSGLVAISGGYNGFIQNLLLSEKSGAATQQVERLKLIFPEDLFLQIQKLGGNRDVELLEKTTEIASLAELPLLAANNPRFLNQDDYLSLDARVCIDRGDIIDNTNRVRDYTPEQYFKTEKEMADLFSDIPEAVQNTVNLAKKCNFQFTTDQAALPAYTVPKGQTIKDFLNKEAKKGLEKTSLSTKEEKAAYTQRLDSELKIINSTGFSGYFLIVADFIKWSRLENIPVGPGRGSGPGSLVAFCLGITDIDPMKYDLLFERFLNPERVSMPDFDIDFCVNGRDRVIDYVSNRYGSEMVSQIITYGTMSAKAVVRDVGRILGYPYGMVDQIAKLIPFDIGITIKSALKKEPELSERYEKEQDVQALINLALKLEGLIRNAGKHAGGVVIAPSNLSDFMPLYTVEGEAGTVTQFDKDDVESIGLIKFDFLGLKTLTVIQNAVELINKKLIASGEKNIDIRTIPTNDSETYKLLSSANTVGIFQLESTGMRELIKRMQPSEFDDLIALVALFRPGPLQSGMADLFIERKAAGQSQLVNTFHPMLEQVLRTTYGVIVYQEQVMQIAQKLANYSQGSADMLRKAMGKKIPEEMSRQRDIFIQGAVENNVKESTARRIYDLIEKFAGYGFNKSHSVSYALIAYQTAWLKTHYLAEFMAASMTADIDNTDKLIRLKEDCIYFKLDIMAPCINHSSYDFVVENSNTLRYGLGAIKGMGKYAAEAITNERLNNGSYTDFFDFCSRLAEQKLSKRTIEALIKSGALDCLDETRSTLNNSIEIGLNYSNKKAMDRESGQNSLFFSDTDQLQTLPKLRRKKEWELNVLLRNEYQSLGFYFSGHPFDPYRKDCTYITKSSLDQLTASLEASNGSYRSNQQTTMGLAGLVTGLKRRGENLIFKLDDGTASIDVIVFGERKDNFRDLLIENAVLHLKGNLRFDAYADKWQFVAEGISGLDQLIEKKANTLLIECDTNFDPDKLKSILQAYIPGSCKVNIHYKTDIDVYRLQLSEEWTVNATKELRDQLTVEFGSGNFQFLTDN
jgi:DNA polymerase-3 subunit alpha